MHFDITFTRGLRHCIAGFIERNMHYYSINQNVQNNSYIFRNRLINGEQHKPMSSVPFVFSKKDIFVPSP